MAKGDKPLGRPRTKHLKPPVGTLPLFRCFLLYNHLLLNINFLLLNGAEKRPRGRPRKDTSKELVSSHDALSILSKAAGKVPQMTSN